MSENNKLFLIDGISIVFRAYHALASSGLKNSLGEPTGAVFGFANIITSLPERYQPRHIAVVFDRSEPTFRHIQYPAYKSYGNISLLKPGKKVEDFEIVNKKEI